MAVFNVAQRCIIESDGRREFPETVPPYTLPRRLGRVVSPRSGRHAVTTATMRFTDVGGH